MRGTPGRACPQPALSCPVAPASQRELHKDGGGGGGGVARRARTARAPKPKCCAKSCGTSSATSCAASFTFSSFMCHLRAGVGGARVRVAARRITLFFCLKGCVRRVLYVLVLHVSTATATGPAAPTRASNVQRVRDDEETVDEETLGRAGGGQLEKERATMTRSTMNTFTLPSFAAPGFRRMKMTRATSNIFNNNLCWL